MTNKEKFLNLVSKEPNNSLERNKERIRNRAMLKESQKIALKVLMKLDELKWSQKMLAEKMGVSPQQITKIVSGKENLSIETQIKLQTILNIPILASYYEDIMLQIVQSISEIVKYEPVKDLPKEGEPKVDCTTNPLIVVYNKYDSNAA